MQIAVLQDTLNAALGNVLKAIEAKPALRSLGNVLLEADESRLRIVGSSLHLSITEWIGAKVDQPGSITLPAKTFADLISKLSKERVDITLDEETNTVTAKCGSTKSRIKGLAATEYPPVKQSDEPGITMNAKTLKSMILQTIFAAAKNENRPILVGLHILIDGDVLTMAAADGYRIAIRTAHLDESAPRKVDMVIPARAMLEVARMIDEDELSVTIAPPGENNIVTFHLKNSAVSSQILDGKFPDFSATIPNRYSTQGVIDTQDWLKKCQIAEIFARDEAHNGRMQFNPPTMPGGSGEIIIAGESAERGDADNLLDAHVEGNSLKVEFDIRCVVEVLNVIEEDNVVFQSNGADSPGVFRPQGRSDFVYILMPMGRK